MFNSNKLIKNTRLNKLYKQNFIALSQSSKVWEINFTTEILWNGRETKFITLIDQSKKIIVSIEAIELTISLETQLLKILDRLGKSKHPPSLLVYDNSASISLSLDKWCRDHSVKQIYFYLYFGNSIPNSYLARHALRRNADTIFSCNHAALLNFK